MRRVCRRAVLTSGVALLAGSCVVPAGPPPSPRIAPGPAPQPVLPSPVRDTFRIGGAARQGAVLKGLVPTGTRRLMLDGAPVPFAADGTFLVAFDRDAAPSALLRAERDALPAVSLALGVAPGDWRIEQINASPTGSATSAAFRRLRPLELAEINAARALGPGIVSDGWRQDFVWPVVARISGRFGSQRVYRGQPGSYHSGVDLAAPTGTVYVAPADGVVTLAADRTFTLEGRLLIVDHGMGLSSAFLHSERLLVKAGEVVRRGQPLGLVGATGRATGPHLHWGMKWNAARLDPVTLVNAPEPAAR